MASVRHGRKGARHSTAQSGSPSQYRTMPDSVQNMTLAELPDPPAPIPGPPAQWVEPPLRPPAPSYEDHRGLEGHGVLEYMAPLGTMPNTKVKQRLKHIEQPRKGTAKGTFAKARHDTATPEPIALAALRRPDVRPHDERHARALSSRLQAEDKDYVPQGFQRAPAPKPIRTAAPSTPGSSRSPTTPASIKKVVDASIKQAEQNGNPYLGLALGRLYVDSLYNPKLAGLLQSVLAKRQTESDMAQFQEYIKTTKRDVKVEHRRKKHLLNGKLISYAHNGSFCRWWRSYTPLILLSRVRIGFRVRPPTTYLPHFPSFILHHQLTNSMKGHATPPKVGRPRKKAKRSESASSLSTLRSLSSPAPDSGPSRDRSVSSSNHHNNVDGRAQPRVPKLHLFQPRGNKLGSSQPPSKLANESLGSSPILHPGLTADAAELKRRNVPKQHDLEIRESNIRRSPSVQKPPRMPFTGASKIPLPKSQQTQLRNGTVRRNLHDESDDGLSPPPEVLKPPEGIERRITRGGTPLQPYRIVKKGARIKTS